MKISVVIAAYNASTTIERAVRSVLAQTRPADEIIVVDDGSTDGTVGVARKFSPAVRLISQPNGGASVARNRGIEDAMGDWIAFLDADDEWLPGKLRLQEEQLCTYPDLVWGYGNFIGSDGNQVFSKPVLPSLTTPDTFFEDYLEAYCRGYFVWTSVVVVRRNVFLTTGSFLAGMKRGQDTDLWFRIAYSFPRVGYIGKPLAIYHRDTPGSSTKVNVQYEFMIQLMERHLALSAQYGRREAFLPCISNMLENWIRQLIRDGLKKEAGDLLERYLLYLPNRFIREVRLRLSIPSGMNSIIDIYFNIKNVLKRKR